MQDNSEQNREPAVTRNAIIERDEWIELFEQACGVILGAILVYGASASANLF